MAFSGTKDVAGSRRFMFVVQPQGAGHTGTTAGVTRWLVGNGTHGVALGAPWKLTKLEVTTDVTAESADASYVVTAYNGAPASGTRALETSSLVLTAVAAVRAEAVTPTNAGKEIFSATDQLLVKGVYAAPTDSATLADVNVYIHGEWAE